MTVAVRMVLSVKTSIQEPTVIVDDVLEKKKVRFKKHADGGHRWYGSMRGVPDKQFKSKDCDMTVER
jgi:hypothetical protein